MGVRRESKHELAAGWHERYLKADRKERSRLLDEFVSLSGYHRKYATVLLKHGLPPQRGYRGYIGHQAWEKAFTFC